MNNLTADEMEILKAYRQLGMKEKREFAGRIESLLKNQWFNVFIQELQELQETGGIQAQLDDLLKEMGYVG